MPQNISVNSSTCSGFHTRFASKSFVNNFLTCFSSTRYMYGLVALCIAYCLFLPFFFPILSQAIKQWRQRKTKSAAVSLSDLITYQSIVIQLDEILGLVVFFCGSYLGSGILMLTGIYIWGVTLTGKTFFHLLTCVERYLAVVHPIIFLGLRQGRRVSIPYISIGCVWLLSFTCLSANFNIGFQSSVNSLLISMGFNLLIVLYCSISVLYVLKRPVPGDNKRVDQSKQRAFHTIMVVMGVMVLRLGGSMIINVTYASHIFCDVCALLHFSLWLDLPSTLVLPLLFLYRVRKLTPRKSG